MKFRKLTKDVILLSVLLSFGYVAPPCFAGTHHASRIEQSLEKITGKVTDVQGEPVPGVTVRIDGTTKGVVTDIDGNFSIEANRGQTLIISFIGYETRNIRVDSQKLQKIVLEEDVNQLDEVVVIGFGTQKKENLTGAVGVADMKMLEERPVQNALQMLQGVVPGLNIMQASGDLNTVQTINVRGEGTIGAGSKSQPLILIDGMEGDLSAINPQDIESISVLKDVASSSIYGSRAPFGVVLVKTKNGTIGKVKINYNNNLRWNSPIDIPHMLNSYDFAIYFNDAGINAGVAPQFSDERIQRIKDFMDGKLKTNTIVDERNGLYWENGFRNANDNVDWYDALYRSSAFSHEHNLSISGGTEKARYYVSANYMDQKGFMEFNRDKSQRYTVTAKLSATLTNNLTVNLSSRFTRKDHNRPSQLGYGLYGDLARQGWPTCPLYDPNGYMFSSPSPALAIRDGGTSIIQADQFYQQAQVVYEPVKNWKLFGELNYKIDTDFNHSDTQICYNHDIYGEPYAVPQNKISEVHEDAAKYNFFSSNVYSEYSFNLNKQHHFKALLGFQTELSKARNLGATRQGILVPELPVLGITSGLDINGNLVIPEVGGVYNHWATVGYFGRLNYDFKEKYLFEVNLRYDGTSRFRPNDRWQLFPSVSAGWNIAKEQFWGKLKQTVNTFKFRASYGELGNQNTSNLYPTYLTMPVTAGGGTWLLNGKKPNISNMPGIISQSLTWERVRNLNLGIDLGMFENRLTASYEYYVRFTEDMIGPAPQLPVTLGTAPPSINNTDLKTYGFELELTWKDRLKNGLFYSARLLLSDSQTKITRYPNLTGTIGGHRVGKKLGEIWGYETIGIAKSQDEMDAHLASLPNGGQDQLEAQWEAGDVMYRDLNGDGKISAGANTVYDCGDRKIIGNSTPRYHFGLDLNASYRGVDIRTFFQGVLKCDYFQDSYYFWGARNDVFWSTGFEEHKDYFRADPEHPFGQNLNSYYPRPLFGKTKANKNAQYQTRYLQDASYIRLKNLQIGYTIPLYIVKKLGLSKCRIYVSGENLLTFTKLTSIFDPETIGGGYGGNGYPLSRVYSVGISLDF